MKPVTQRLIRQYVIGFGVSLALTIASYLVATTHHGAMTGPLVMLLVGLAVSQIIVQLVCFLHLGHEDAPRWNTTSFITMVMVVLFIVIGSIWIMNNLNYNMMHPGVEDAIMHDEGMQP